MPRELYVKPEIKSEILEPEALCGAGSPVGEFTPNSGGNGCFDLLKWIFGNLN